MVPFLGWSWQMALPFFLYMQPWNRHSHNIPKNCLAPPVPFCKGGQVIKNKDMDTDIHCPQAICKKISIVNIESSTVTNHEIIQAREGKGWLSHPLHLLPRKASFLPYIIKCFVQPSFELFKQFDIHYFLWETTLQFRGMFIYSLLYK